MDWYLGGLVIGWTVPAQSKLILLVSKSCVVLAGLASADAVSEQLHEKQQPRQLDQHD